MSALSPLGQAAVALASRGIAVFPLQPRDKKPFADTAGFKDALEHEGVTAKRWRQRPDANIGIATGARSAFWVLDIDGPDAEAAVAALEREHGALPRTVEQRTGRGRHVCFAWPEQCEPYDGVRNSASRIGPHVDVRGCGGYIVAPPSIHPSGRVYAWSEGCSPFEIDFALAPAWLWDMALPRDVVATPATPYVHQRAATHEGTSRYGEVALANACNAIASAAPGVQNQRLWDKSIGIGCLVAGGEIDGVAAKSALISAGLSMSAANTPWTFKIVESAVRRAFEWAQGYPRSAPNREMERKPRPAVWTRPIVEGPAPMSAFAASNEVEKVDMPVSPPMPDDLAGFLESGAQNRKHALGVGRMGGVFVSNPRARKKRRWS